MLALQNGFCIESIPSRYLASIPCQSIANQLDVATIYLLLVHRFFLSCFDCTVNSARENLADLLTLICYDIAQRDGVAPIGAFTESMMRATDQSISIERCK